MIDTQITIRHGRGTKTVALGEYLDGPAEERAQDAAHAWIKALRAVTVDGSSFRDRFTIRGDSLWWFTELYLHKERAILDVHRVILAVEALLEREQPASLSVSSGSALAGHVIPRVAAARRVSAPGGTGSFEWMRRLVALDARARMLSLAALATADRWRRVPCIEGTGGIAAFIHRAFWRAGGDDGAAESYIGPTLAELERRLPGAVHYVGIGPTTNFRTPRRWPVQGDRDASPAMAIERFAGWSALAAARTTWRRRYTDFRVLRHAPALRQAARIRNVDCWPIVREQLAGIAWLQWPWSVRAMDESAGALDALRPDVAVTYAEAGGWGRALILEARRRGIPTAGLQHGFIYRHWLNYRHEPDERAPGRTPPFPAPTRTLVFDEYAARHLAEAGGFPADSLEVTGSPRLDDLARDIASLPAGDAMRVRDELGIARAETLVLVTTKEKEARGVLPGLVAAADATPGCVLVIKPHPAETAEAYGWISGDRNVRVVEGPVSLARLLGAARAVVTVNSTVALDAGALDIPALAIGLPNNLSPFVESGAIAGSPDPAQLTALLGRILYDEGFRRQLAARRRALFGEPVTARHGRAASRSADAVLELVHGNSRATAESG